jgi:hypothetical protein
VYKWRMVLGGVAAASFLGTFAAGPALASTASPDRVPVVVSIVPAPTGVVPAVGAATGALLNGVGNVIAALSGTLVPAIGPAVGVLLGGVPALPAGG